MKAGLQSLISSHECCHPIAFIASISRGFVFVVWSGRKCESGFLGRDVYCEMPVYDGATLGSKNQNSLDRHSLSSRQLILILAQQNAIVDDYGNIVVASSMG